MNEESSKAEGSMHGPVGFLPFAALAVAVAFWSVTTTDDDHHQVAALIGQTAPDLTLVDYTGKQVTLSALRGKVVLVVFWYPDCHSCKEELPLLEEIYERYKEHGFEIVAVDVTADTKGAVEFRDVSGLTFSMVAGDREAALRDWGVGATPSSFLIDRAGKIVSYNGGFRKGDENSLDEEIAIVIAD